MGTSVIKKGSDAEHQLRKYLPAVMGDKSPTVQEGISFYYPFWNQFLEQSKSIGLLVKGLSLAGLLGFSATLVWAQCHGFVAFVVPVWILVATTALLARGRPGGERGAVLRAGTREQLMERFGLTDTDFAD